MKAHMISQTVVDRDLVWTSVHGIKTKIKDMDDAYLANLYDYLKHRSKKPVDLGRWRFDKELMAVIEVLRKERGLETTFMKRAQIPYKNPAGRWEIWNHKLHCPMEVSS